MINHFTRKHLSLCSKIAVMALLVLTTSCARKTDTGADEHVTQLGSIEVTARLVEIPGEIRDDPLYDYAHVMKYEIVKVHRGTVPSNTLYVGHYNPIKPRIRVADERVETIGGNLRLFKVGDIHRMALEVPIDDYFMGGIINKYFGRIEDPIHWALWTNRVIP